MTEQTEVDAGDPPARRRERLTVRRTRLAVPMWRVALLLGDRAGRLARVVFVDARGVMLLAALAPAGYYAIRAEWDMAALLAALWLLGLMLIGALNARNRVIVGDFKHSAGMSDASATGTPASTVDLGNLLLVEIARLGDLFTVVGDQRAVSSGLGHQRALDATLSVDDLVETLQGTISAETKASFGPITIPLAPLMMLFAKLVQAPRLAGNLHQDGDMLIVTAQTSGRGSLSWRVEARTGTAGSPGVSAVVSGMVEELALRIYTDLALGRAVRWEASRSFVEGLRCFRSCLRTPKDRKVNLRKTEELFLEALAEDEDFPLVYYNLGVVYTELHGLADAAGRSDEAEMRLSAAETSFGRAIEKDPGRWDCYLAFAHTQYRYERYDSVVDLCGHILALRPGWSAEAKTRELLARALLRRRPDDYGKAFAHARRASQFALRCLLRARLVRRPAARAEDDDESRCAELAAGCLLTFSDIYSRQMRSADAIASGDVRRWHQRHIRSRVQSLSKLAPLPEGTAELQFGFGRRALAGGHLELAEEELAAAARSNPTHPEYSAGLALARATRLTDGDRKVADPQREEIVALCLRALQGMAGAFFPSRDAQACGIVADVFDRMGDPAHDDLNTAAELRAVADEVDRKLRSAVGGASVSSIFLESLQSSSARIASKIGAYGEAAQHARAHLVAGQDLSGTGTRRKALDEFRQALQCAERATSLNPLSTLAWETLGDVHRELSDFQNARTAWKQALGTDPDNPRLYDKIGSSYWQIAFIGRARPLREDLEQAADHFGKALLLYASGSFDEQVLTHYRLGKLHAALRNFGEARRHLEIVEAVSRPPLVGWQALGFAHLELRDFAESEYYFGRVVREGAQLGRGRRPDFIPGDRLDEQHWPLAMIRAWGHLGLAIAAAERDGNLERAREQLDIASALLDELGLDPEDAANDERFPTRVRAAIVESRGLVQLRAGDLDGAISTLETAVSGFPHSRAYFELALALEQRARRDVAARGEDVPRAMRLLGHAVSLGPRDEPYGEIKEVLERLRELRPVNGAAAA